MVSLEKTWFTLTLPSMASTGSAILLIFLYMVFPFLVLMVFPYRYSNLSQVNKKD